MVKVGGGGGVKAEMGCLTQLTDEQEQLDRADFVEWLTPTIKAEFVLGESHQHGKGICWPLAPWRL